jgi:uncharacterized protein YbbC (DUF1343 family)
VHVLDRVRFEPVRTAVALIDELHREAPSRFAWRDPPYEYEHDKMPIDILFGSDRLRTGIERARGADEIAQGWQDETRAFLRVRDKYLLY